MKLFRVAVSAFLLALMPLGHAEVRHGFTVDAAWLETNLGRDDLVVVDTRDPRDFASAHIPGAINVPVADTFRKGARSDLLAPISQIKELFRAAGIRNQDQIVLYDDGRFLAAARVFWVFEVYGHRKVSILNEGFAAWRSRGAPSSAEVVRRPRSDYLPSVDPRRLATKLSTRLATRDDDIVLIDARSEAEYLGRESTATRHGRIPSAQSMPASRLLTGEQPQIRPLDELARLFGHIPKDKQVITYCNQGQHAAIAYFTLRELGYDVAAYDGSWFEWGNDHSLPIERERQPER